MSMTFRDNPNNILGANTADNLFNSSDVTSNADGSIIERQEYIQGVLGGVAAGQVILQGAADAGTNSTTVIPIAELAGYGDDFFNNQFYLQVLHNENSAGNAPEKQTRKITDYVSATGTFTCDAFSAAVQESDLCYILHESQVAIGSDNSNNVFDSSNVAANVDGSVLERLEDIKDKINTVNGFVDTEISTLLTEVGTIKGYVGGVDSASTILGSNNNNNGFESNQVVANVDGSVLERLEDLKDRVDAVDNYVDGEVGAIKAVTDLLPDAGALTSIAQEATLGVPAGADLATDIAAISTLIGVPVGADISADIAAVQVEVDKIGIPAGADVSTDIAAISTLIGVPVGADISTDIATVQIEVDKIGTPAGADMSTDIAAVNTLVTNFSAAGGDGKAVIRRTVTFDNTNAAITLFKITGGVNFKLYAFCTTNVESAVGCNMGVGMGGSAIIAETDCTTLEANDIWHDASPDASMELESVHEKYTAYGGTILLSLQAEKQVDSGVIIFVCIYTPITVNGVIALE